MAPRTGWVVPRMQLMLVQQPRGCDQLRASQTGQAMNRGE
jgi:hypothetical protein